MQAYYYFYKFWNTDGWRLKALVSDSIFVLHLLDNAIYRTGHFCLVRRLVWTLNTTFVLKIPVNSVLQTAHISLICVPMFQGLILDVGDPTSLERSDV